jgi:hypothetical protein
MCAQIIALFSLCAIAYAGDSGPTFVFPDFASSDGLSLVGSAEKTGKVLRLTRAAEQTAGAAWAREKQAVGNGFETTFQFQITGQGGLGHGADGFAFVLQNSGPSAIAGRGGAGGFALGDGFGSRNSPGIPNSIAVFFDTYRNEGEPSANYIAVCTNGSIAEMRWPPARLAYTRRLRVHLKDGRVHTVRLLYKPPILSVFVDEPAKPVLISTVDLATVVDRQGTAYFGFTASTGAGYENHDILSWSFSAGLKMEVSSNIAFMKAACLPDRNLCTPDQVVVEETAPGRYHVVLPANLAWGASIPNPSSHAFAVTNARGTICWDLKNRGADGCSGPAVDVVINGSQADAKPGALISRTNDGRTYFSVNDPSGAFDDNEGFVEFDVEVR